VNERHTAAIAYAEMGTFVFPARRDKRPYTPQGFKDASISLSVISAWWARWPDANVAIDLERSGLLVVDVDGPEGIEPLAALELPATRTVTTGRPEGGQHHYYEQPDEAIKTTILGPKLDLRGAGAYVIAPPSIHASGARYESDGQPIARLSEADVERIRESALEHARATGRLPNEKPQSTRRTFTGQDATYDALKGIPTEAYFWLLVGRELDSRGFAVCPLHDDGDEDGGSFHACYGTGWRCFGCGQRGDVFNLAAALWGSPPFPEVRKRLVEAVLRGGQDA
jgi:hypothetical protein